MDALDNMTHEELLEFARQQAKDFVRQGDDLRAAQENRQLWQGMYQYVREEYYEKLGEWPDDFVA